MPVPLGNSGQTDFTQPIELMMDCHRRIEHFLAVLRRIAERYANQPLDDEGCEALETALNYFHSAAPRHTADEEESLFPLLRRIDDPHVRETMAQIDRLESDHRRTEVAHTRLDELGQRWRANGMLSTDAFAAFRELLVELATTYGEHIPIEDQSVFVVAKRVLDNQQLQAVGEEMRQRRIEYPGRRGSRCAERRQQRLASQEAADG